MMIDLLWAAVDKFKEAILLVREQDLEAEGAALSRMGTAFEALNMPTWAHRYHHAAVVLALSMNEVRPLVVSTKWFKESNEAVARFQAAFDREEQKQNDADRSEIKEQMKEELENLEREAAASAQSFLAFLYDGFRPKNANHKLGSTDTKNATRAALRQAIGHYHPDKNPADEHGAKWHVLCEEITKRLNLKYEAYK